MPEKILIIQTAFIGDVVLSTSLVENLNQAFPAAKIDFLVRKGNETLLENNPYLRKVLIWEKNEHKTRNLFTLLRTIRKEKYGAVINVQRYAATGILTAFSGAKQKIGFNKNPLSFLFTKRIKHEFGNFHEIERNYKLISHLVNAQVKKPRLYTSPADEQTVRAFTAFPYITISPASVWFTKQYPVQKWADFLNKLPAGLKIFILGGKDDRSLGEALIQMTVSRSPMNLCGELTFLQSAELMKHAVMNYVNDSAPMHFASAVNAPVTAIYCSTVQDFGYGPLSDVRFIVERDEPLYCRPCGLHGYETCPQKHFKCALDINDEQLLKSIATRRITPPVP